MLPLGDGGANYKLYLDGSRLANIEKSGCCIPFAVPPIKKPDIEDAAHKNKQKAVEPQLATHHIDYEEIEFEVGGKTVKYLLPFFIPSLNVDENVKSLHRALMDWDDEKVVVEKVPPTTPTKAESSACFAFR